jgi:hypothetical protein
MMNTNHVAKLVFATTLTWGTTLASDVHIGVDIGRPHKERYVEQPTCERVWIPETVVQRTERVLVRAARTERREEVVCVEEERTIRREERVLVEAARTERVVENVLVRPASIERSWVPPIVEKVKLGPVRIERVVREGYYREIPIAAEYRSQVREYTIPAKYQNVCRNVVIPAKYERVCKKVEIPAEYQDITRNVIIPGHYETRSIERVIVTPVRSNVDVDVEGFMKRKSKDRRHNNDDN